MKNEACQVSVIIFYNLSSKYNQTVGVQKNPIMKIQSLTASFITDVLTYNYDREQQSVKNHPLAAFAL